MSTFGGNPDSDILRRRSLSLDRSLESLKQRTSVTALCCNRLIVLFLLTLLLIVNALYLYSSDFRLSPKESLGKQFSLLFSPNSEVPCTPGSANADLNAPGFAKTKALAFIGVNSCFGNEGRRIAIRETWLPKGESNNSNGLIFKFVIGRSNNETIEKALQLEQEIHGDLLRLDHIEDYTTLNRKTMAFFKLTFALYDAEYYVKMDDDIYVIPARLKSFLMQKRESPNVYWGCMMKGPVMNEPTNRWYEPFHYLLPNEYTLHAVGPMYGLSKSVVQLFNQDPPIGRRMMANEDVMIGLWALAWDIDFVSDGRLCTHTCTSETVAVWETWGSCAGLCNPEESIRSLHANPECRTNQTVVKLKQ